MTISVLTALNGCMNTTENSFNRLYTVVQKLRGPGGCPWDREQSPESLRGDLIEETYECIEAIDEKNPEHIKEELGDIFLLATMISYMHEQEGSFSVQDALEEVSEKLIRRHPHVFGNSSAKTSSEVLDQWAKIKVEQEGRKPKDSILDEVSQALPPLERAYKLQKKAAKTGFDWDNIEAVWEKIHEEITEVKDACDKHELDASSSNREHIEEELGDLLFSVINICRYLKADPALALQRTNNKFIKRFKHVEQEMKKQGEQMQAGKLHLMDRFWNEAKKL